MAMLTFTCEACGDSFRRFPSDVKKSTPRFCSRSCYRAGIRNNVERSCPECGETFSTWQANATIAEKRGHRMYCSAACRDVAHARARVRRVAVSCAACGAPMQVIPARADGRRLFCSYACMGTQASSWVRHGWGKGGIRPDLGHYVRSRWEANVARVLLALGVPYEYEPRTFRCGDQSYTPDFRIAGAWIEVKGWMRPAAQAKIEAFRAHYPDERLIVVDADVYAALAAEWRERLPGWEA